MPNNSLDAISKEDEEVFIASCITFREDIGPTIFSRVDRDDFETKGMRTFYQKFDQFVVTAKRDPSKMKIVFDLMSTSAASVEDKHFVSDALKYQDTVMSSGKDDIMAYVSRFIKRKAMREAMASSIPDLDDPDKYSLIEKRLKEAMVRGSFGSLALDYFSKEAFEKRSADRLNNLTGAVKTGLSTIDSVLLETGNAVARGTMNIISGKSNIGKSIWLGQLAINMVKQAQRVLIVSLEMDENLYSSRIDTNMVKGKVADGVTSRELLANNPTALYNMISDVRDQYSIKDKTGKIIKRGELFVKQLPGGVSTINDVAALLDEYKMRGQEIDAVCLDYLNLLRPAEATGRDAKSYEKIKLVAEEVRALASRYNIVMWTATQLNRSGYNAQPALDQIQDSMGTVHTADFMIGIFQDADDQKLGYMRFNILKNRYGPKDLTVRCFIDYSHLHIHDTGALVENADRSAVSNQHMNGVSEDVTDLKSKISTKPAHSVGEVMSIFNEGPVEAV
jgi:replicative DNA helicase